MARQKKLRSRFGAVIFVLFIAGTGTALAATDHMHDPFEVIPNVLGINNDAAPNGEGRRPEGDFRPPDGDFDANRRPPDGNFRGGERNGEDRDQDGGGTGIQWNQIGDVLYNLWVIGAGAAVVMVVGTPIGRGLKRLRRTKKPNPPTPAATPNTAQVSAESPEVQPENQSESSE